MNNWGKKKASIGAPSSMANISKWKIRKMRQAIIDHMKQERCWEWNENNFKKKRKKITLITLI